MALVAEVRCAERRAPWPDSHVHADIPCQPRCRHLLLCCCWCGLGGSQSFLPAHVAGTVCVWQGRVSTWYVIAGLRETTQNVGKSTQNTACGNDIATQYDNTGTAHHAVSRAWCVHCMKSLSISRSIQVCTTTTALWICSRPRAAFAVGFGVAAVLATWATTRCSGPRAPPQRRPSSVALRLLEAATPRPRRGAGSAVSAAAAAPLARAAAAARLWAAAGA